MNQPYEPTDREAATLAGLAIPAPASLRPAVLVEVGLADHYDRVDSPLGPIVVAWNGRGVSSPSRFSCSSSQLIIALSTR